MKAGARANRSDEKRIGDSGVTRLLTLAMQQVMASMSPAGSTSISRLSRLCRRSPVRHQQSLTAAREAPGPAEWGPFRRQMSHSSEPGEPDELLLHPYGSYLGAGSGRSSSVSPEPSTSPLLQHRSIESCSTGLAYLERGTADSPGSLDSLDSLDPFPSSIRRPKAKVRPPALCRPSRFPSPPIDGVVGEPNE